MQDRDQPKRRRRFLILSGHDYRSKRKASVHFLADELARAAEVRFFSVGYSVLSRIKNDPRRSLWQQSGKVERFQDVECYLDRSLLHPVRLAAIDGGLLTKAWLRWHVANAPKVLQSWIRDSDVIILESGLALIYFDLIKRVNPDAATIYAAADRLETIGCSTALSAILTRIASSFDLIRVPSPVMLDDFGPDATTRVIPQGFARKTGGAATASPFTSRRNAVSVGSMLFDADAVMALCRGLPDMHVHVIGGGRHANGLTAPNLTVHDEMPFESTRPYIEHADVGVAPYTPAHVSPYLGDTSLKLAQFGAAGLPAICPTKATGGFPYRFGYNAVDETNLRTAALAALAYGRFDPVIPPSWGEVTAQMLAELDLITMERNRTSGRGPTIFSLQ